MKQHGMNIHHVTKTSWTQPDGKLGFCYHVYYKKVYADGKIAKKPGRHCTYTWKDDLPMTVLRFLMDWDVQCTTSYHESTHSLTGISKQEVYERKEN